MGLFGIGDRYESRKDVRAWDQWGLRERVVRSGPRGVLWPLVGTHRSGRTWALRGLEQRLESDRAHYLDLSRPTARFIPEALEKAGVKYLLIDEPGYYLEQDPVKFISICQKLCSQRVKILVALTPNEWHQLLHADPPGGPRINRKDLIFVPPLTSEETQRFARIDWAKTLLEQLPAQWKRNPFLLEILLVAAEKSPALLQDLPALIEAALEASEDPRYAYTRAVFQDSLTDEQRDLVRCIVRGARPQSETTTLLTLCGVLQRTDQGPVLADPVLEQHLLPPLVIHHLSDIHLGAREEHGAQQTKTPGALAYLQHLRSLAEIGQAPHMLVLTGDLTETGSGAEYDQMRGWLKQLESCLAPHPAIPEGQSPVLLVPGSHDTDWSQALGTARSRDRHLLFAQAFADYPRPKLEEPATERSLTMVRLPRMGLEILLLGSTDFGSEGTDGAEGLNMMGFLDGLRHQAFSERNGDKAQKDRDHVARLVPGFVHPLDLQQVRRQSWTLPVRFAVLHHPLSALPIAPLARFVGLINAGEVKDALFAKRISLVLHGYAHAGWFGREQWPDRYGERSLSMIAAPALTDRERPEQQGFNEVVVLREGVEYHMQVHRYRRDGARWVDQAQMGPLAPSEPF